ncbi:MAG TPA: peptidylprolyl isomerase [Pyrinomonadaceae bacterium]|nr:peptidylprolyl isomerase [Pyrinomonadaceae bacterium]
MRSLNEYIAMEINGESVSLRQVLRFAKWGNESRFLRNAADAVLIRQAMLEAGIGVTDEEVQRAADSFRAKRDLYDEKRTERWLAKHYLSQAEWETLLEDEIMRAKLRDALTTSRVEQYFAEQRLSFDAATISRIVVKEENVARELRAQIIEDDEDFYSLARKHSIDMLTRPAGGYSGLVRRSEMEPAMEAAVFGTQPGKSVGPIKTYAGWQLVKVEAIHLATLDNSLRETIKSLLFEEWLANQRVKARIRIPLLEHEEAEL